MPHGPDSQATLHQRVTDAVGAVVEPDVELPLADLGLVRGVVVEADRAVVAVAELVPAGPWRDRLRTEVDAAARRAGAAQVRVDLVQLTDDQRVALRTQLEGPTKPTPEQAFSGARVLAISSGKGGVGKSSISVNVAVALARRGRRVALIDADVYGFSIPRMLGVDRRPAIVADLVIPPKAHGVSVVSVAFFATDEQSPIIWRGPMLHKALSQFVTDVRWAAPEYVLVDMPPGTGDVALTMSQLLPLSEVVVVTTPQPAAQKVAQRSAYMARKVNLTVTGVIENMSHFTGNDGERYELFGSGGGDLLAQQLDVPLLGKVPLVPALREGGDEGRPIMVTDPQSEGAAALDAVVDALVAHRPQRMRLPVLKVT
jgi:ATP-binding protein involved in chromosome partitioning